MAKLIKIDSKDGILPLVCCFVMMFSVSAAYKAQAVFYHAFYGELGFSDEEASWPLTIYQFSMNFSGLLLGPLCQWLSVRVVTTASAVIGTLGFFAAYFVNDVVLFCLTFGLMGGVSFGAVMLSTSILMTQYFEKYRAVTIGIAFSGAAVGSFIYPSLLTLLVKQLSFHGMLACYAGICLLSVPLAIFLKEARTDLPTDSDVVNKSSSEAISIWTQLSVFKAPLFWVLVIPTVWYYWANSLCMSVLIDYTKGDKGFSEWQAVNLVTFFGVTEIAGQFILPQVCDRGLILRETLMLINFVMSGILLLVIPLCKSYAAVVSAICIFGSFYGLTATFYRCFVGEYLGFHRMKLAFGLIVAIKGLVLLTVPPVLGYVRGTLHNYEHAYNLSGAVLLVLSTLWIPVIYIKRKRLHDTAKV